MILNTNICFYYNPTIIIIRKFLKLKEFKKIKKILHTDNQYITAKIKRTIKTNFKP